MPRKQNGWGSQGKGFSFPKGASFSKSLKPGAWGDYPSDRRYGSSVTRSVVEKYNMDSDWAKWRKGYEYYIRAAWDELVVLNPNYQKEEQPGIDTVNQYIPAKLESVLYQGTGSEIETVFYGWEFPTANADTNTHFVAKRETKTSAYLGEITEVWNNETLYPEQKANREIWCKGKGSYNSRLLLKLEGERLTDGETEATLKTVLDSHQKPAIYKGKTYVDPDATIEEQRRQSTQVRVEIPVDNITEGDLEEGKEYHVSQGLKTYKANISSEQGLANPSNLVGMIVYVPEFFIEKSIADLDAIVWADGNEYFGTSIVDIADVSEVYCVEPESQTLPPSMYDIRSLPHIFKATDSQVHTSGTYMFQKRMYQKYWGDKYLTADIVESIAKSFAYSLLPFTIKSAEFRFSNGQPEKLILTSVPFTSEVRVYPEITEDSYLIFPDNSFCKYRKHGEWTHMYTDVQPWQDEVFTTGEQLKPASTYTCSCPSHSHSILAIPQATSDANERKTNRQRRYPLPTVQGLDRWQALGVEQISGKLSTWETGEHYYSLKLCKHSIATRFIEKIKVIEPSAYMTAESRIQFEKKLEEEVSKFGYEFQMSYKRSRLSLSEIIFSLAQGLNLDGVETAYVLFNS